MERERIRVRTSVVILGNLALLVVNVLLLAAIGVSAWSKNVEALPSAIRSDQQALGMEVYCYRDPFAIYVDEMFPENKQFAFCRYGGAPFAVSAGDVTGTSKLSHDGALTDRTAESITLTLGKDSSITCDLDAAGHAQEIMVTRSEGGHIESFVDLNADGQPDLRVIVDNDNDLHRTVVWYDDCWTEAKATGRKYIRALQSGEVIEFDRKEGKWVSARPSGS